MARILIPTQREADVESWTQRTELDGRDYLLSFSWSRREERWFLDVADESASPIAQNIKLVAGWPMLLRVVDERRPPGEIMVVDQAALDAEGTPDLQIAVDPGLDDLGARVVLVYLDAAEIASIAAG